MLEDKYSFVLSVGDNIKLTTYIKSLDKETVLRTAESVMAMLEELDFSQSNKVVSA